MRGKADYNLQDGWAIPFSHYSIIQDLPHFLAHSRNTINICWRERKGQVIARDTITNLLKLTEERGIYDFWGHRQQISRLLLSCPMISTMYVTKYNTYFLGILFLGNSFWTTNQYLIYSKQDSVNSSLHFQVNILRRKSRFKFLF